MAGVTLMVSGETFLSLFPTDGCPFQPRSLRLEWDSTSSGDIGFIRHTGKPRCVGHRPVARNTLKCYDARRHPGPIPRMALAAG